jgi:glycosyltransferase involved in cell wall biosynthesis
VGYDVTATTTGRTGVARYGRELVAAVERCGVEPRLFAVGRGRFDPPPQTRRIRLPVRAVAPVWRHLRVPRAEWLVPGVRLVHTLDMTPPPTRRPVAVTVHDVAALEHPDLHSRVQVTQQRRQLAALSRVQLVCAVSQSTADALVRHGIPAQRIAVTPLGVTRMPAPQPPGLEPPYLLVVGELAARKGLPGLVRAFRDADLPQALRLVLAGPPGHRADEVLRHLDDRVIALGAVSDAQLAGLYAGATALCFPSLAEGFGLPVLEAMAAGLPVVASDIDVVREVAGDAARLVAAGDVTAWRSALEQLWDDPDGRAERAAAGRARAGEFTWDRTAALTVDAYRGVLGCG